MREEMSQTVTQTPWRRRADRLAQVALIILLISVAFGLIYGALDALMYPYVSFIQMVNGPVFQLVSLAYFLAVLLGVPGLLIGIQDGFRGQWVQAGRVLAFVGPLVVLYTVCGIASFLLWALNSPVMEFSWILLSAVWWAGIGFVLRSELRVLGIFTIVVGIAALLDGIVTLLDLPLPFLALVH